MEVVPKMKNIVAVIAAIETYRHPDIKQVEYAKNDALAFKELLINDFGADEANITLWINEHVTRSTLEEELRYIIRQLTEEDKFIFYYAGHGFHHSGVNRLTAWDTHKNNLYDTSVSLHDVLLGPLTGSACTNSLIFIDSCSSYISNGLTGRDMISSMSHLEYENFTEGANFNAIFCSCSPGEKSYPDKPLAHGIWTWHLLQALKGKEPDAIFKERYITDESLKNFLRKFVPRYITKNTHIRGTQTPFATIASSSTFTIRQLPLPEEDEAKAFPKLKLKFDQMEMRKIETERVKDLPGFKKGHFVPDRIGTSGNRYIQSISESEVEEEIQQIYDNCKEILALKRREIVRDSQEGAGSIENNIFRFYLNVYQHHSDPSLAIIERRLIIRVGRSALPENFHEIFPIQPDEVIIPIDGKIDFDDLVDKFENMRDEAGGTLKEDEKKGMIVYKTSEKMTLSIDAHSKEMIIKPDIHLDCLELIDFTTSALKKITGQDLLLLS